MKVGEAGSECDPPTQQTINRWKICYPSFRQETGTTPNYRPCLSLRYGQIRDMNTGNGHTTDMDWTHGQCTNSRHGQMSTWGDLWIWTSTRHGQHLYIEPII